MPTAVDNDDMEGSERGAPRIEGYAELSQIGEGGMSRVYRALELRTETTVAVKVLDQRGPDATRRVNRELQISRRLAGIAGIVSALQHVSTTDGADCLVMPYMEGGSLSSFVVQYSPVLSPGVVAGLGHRIASVLEAAHNRDVLHRDVKPSNLLLDGDSNVHLCDFGIARIRRSDDPATEGTFAYTPGYAAPEQERGDTTDRRTDVYATGATLTALLTGNCPSFDLLGTRRPQEFPADSMPLRAILERATAYLPDRRYQTMGEMVDALAAVHRPASVVIGGLVRGDRADRNGPLGDGPTNVRAPDPPTDAEVVDDGPQAQPDPTVLRSAGPNPNDVHARVVDDGPQAQPDPTVLRSAGPNPNDVHARVVVDADVLRSGGTKTVRIPVMRQCARCVGDRFDPSHPSTCIACSGVGRRRNLVEFEVGIPPRTQSGSILRIDGEGNESRLATKRGDVHLTVVGRSAGARRDANKTEPARNDAPRRGRASPEPSRRSARLLADVQHAFPEARVLWVVAGQARMSIPAVLAMLLSFLAPFAGALVAGTAVDPTVFVLLILLSIVLCPGIFVASAVKGRRLLVCTDSRLVVAARRPPFGRGWAHATELSSVSLQEGRTLVEAALAGKGRQRGRVRVAGETVVMDPRVLQNIAR